MGGLYALATDEGFLLALGAFVSAVLASVGLGHFVPTVKGFIDAGASLVVAVYIASKAHVKAAVVTSTAPAVAAVPVPSGPAAGDTTAAQALAQALIDAATALNRPGG